jgi:hypothetical protein
MAQILRNTRRIISKRRIQRQTLTAGALITFNYAGPKVTDKNPLIIYLYDDGKLMHGINLNYLYEHDVQKLFKFINSVIPIRMISSEKKAEITFTQEINAKKLYESVIKPKLMSVPRTKSCYRTYKSNKMTNLHLVNYKIDVIEKQVRELTGLGRRRLKKAELFKNVAEQKIDVTKPTDDNK